MRYLTSQDSIRDHDQVRGSDSRNGGVMLLISVDRLRAFVGPEPSKVLSARKLAAEIGKHPSFINHLLAGRCWSCHPHTGEAIAQALGVPTHTLFRERATRVTRQDDLDAPRMADAVDVAQASGCTPSPDKDQAA